MASRMASFLPTCLAGVPDSRSLHVRRHPLLSILFLAPTAVTGGVDTWVEVEDFGRDHRDRFAQRVQTPPGLLTGQVVALDGKTTRRSRDRQPCTR